MRSIIFAATMLVLSLSQSAFADGHPTITVPSDSFSVKGKMMNLELSDNGGVITVESVGGRYGRIFLTYNMSVNPNFDSQGAFTGRGMGISEEVASNLDGGLEPLGRSSPHHTSTYCQDLQYSQALKYLPMRYYPQYPPWSPAPG